MTSGSHELNHLVAILEQAYRKKSWHGTNLKGAIRGLSPEQAAWKPGRGRHSIHELVVHAAYWKYAVANRLAGGSRGGFPLTGSNWFVRSRPDAVAWRADVRLLDRMHLDLCTAAGALVADRLFRPLSGSQTTPFTLIAGAAAHDLYHAGQIQLIKALHRSVRPPLQSAP